MAQNKNVSGADEMIRQLQQAQQYIKESVPVVIGVEAVRFFKNAFRKGGLNKKWEARKIPRPGSTNNQNVLIKDEHLMDSIDYKVEGDSVVIFSDLPYAEIHNEGGTISVTAQMKKYFWAKHYEAKEAGLVDVADLWKACALAKKITIPQRQFIGDSPELNQTIIDKITRDLDKIFKS